MRTLIKNGTIVTATDEFQADILVEGEKISAIGLNLPENVDRVIDATGKYVMPGGVDSHCHFEALNTDGVTYNGDFNTSYVCLLGGTTTIVDMAFNEHDENGNFLNLVDSCNYRLNTRIKGKLAPDIALHACCTNYTEETKSELPKLVEMGIPSLKLFLCFKGTEMYADDMALLNCLEAAGKCGMFVLVHAENSDVLDKYRNEAAAAGHFEPKYQYYTRPAFGEAECVSRAIRFADQARCPINICHVSCIEAGEEIRKAKQEGKAVIGEACTAWLTLDWHLMDNPDWRVASHFVCSPPLRDQKDRDYLWNALNKGTISLIGSDNSMTNQEQKDTGWDEENQRCDFRKIPNGCPGAGDRMHVIWTYGVEAGRINRQKYVEACCTTPAKLNGLYPRKGAIAVGSDADIAILDPEYRGTFSVETNPSGVEYSIFEGMEQKGRFETVLLRGKVVVEDAKYVGTPGEGQFIPGKPYGLAYDLLEK